MIYLHLESFQQFLLDYKLNLDGTEHEVTPFLNSLYHSPSTLAFSNIFNQVKAGKTSDAETMLETGLFGLDQGSFMVNYGGTNTQQAAPFILSKMATNQVQSFTVISGPSGIETRPTNNGATNTSLMLPTSPSKTVAILSNMV